MNDVITRPRLTARVTGLLYLITIIGGVAGLLIGQGLYVKGDAAATAARVLASEEAYRLGFVATLVAGLAYVGVTALLYELLKPAGRALSLAAALFSVCGCAIGAATSVQDLAPLMLLKAQPWTAAFQTDQLQTMSMLSARLASQGYNLGLVFFGVYCLLLGALVMRSRFLPKIIGVLLALAGASYLIDMGTRLLAPAWAGALYPWTMLPSLAGEGSLTLWLLAVGVNEMRWREQAGLSQTAAAAA
jgi:hypothetical protein